MVVEAVSGVSFADYMHQKIFEPAGMSQTFLLGEPVPDGLSTAHGYTDGGDQGRLFGMVRPCLGALGKWWGVLQSGATWRGGSEL